MVSGIFRGNTKQKDYSNTTFLVNIIKIFAAKSKSGIVSATLGHWRRKWRVEKGHQYVAETSAHINVSFGKDVGGGRSHSKCTYLGINPYLSGIEIRPFLCRHTYLGVTPLD